MHPPSSLRAAVYCGGPLPHPNPPYESESDGTPPPSPVWFQRRSGALLTTEPPVRVYRHSPYAQCIPDTSVLEDDEAAPGAAPSQTFEGAPSTPPPMAWVALPARARLPRELLADLVQDEFHFLTSGEVCSVPSVTLLTRTRQECQELMKEALPNAEDWSAFLHTLGFKTWHHTESFCAGMIGTRPTDQRVSRYTRAECEDGDRKREIVLGEQCALALKKLVESMSDPNSRIPCILDTDRSLARASFKCIAVFLEDPFWARLWSKTLLRRLFGVHLDDNEALTSHPLTAAARKILLAPATIEKTLEQLRFSPDINPRERARRNSHLKAQRKAVSDAHEPQGSDSSDDSHSAPKRRGRGRRK